MVGAVTICKTACKECETQTTVSVSDTACAAVAHCPNKKCGYSWLVPTETNQLKEIERLGV